MSTGFYQCVWAMGMYDESGFSFPILPSLIYFSFGLS